MLSSDQVTTQRDNMPGGASLRCSLFVQTRAAASRPRKNREAKRKNNHESVIFGAQKWLKTGKFDPGRSVQVSSSQSASAAPAQPAFRIRRHPDGPHQAAQCIVEHQPSGQRFADREDLLQRFQRLHRTKHARERA